MANRQEDNQLHHDPGPAAGPDPALSQPGGRVYQITVKGRLADDWADWLDGLEMTTAEGGNTLLRGTIPDQAALIGVLNKLHRLNVALLSLSRVDHTEES